MIKLRITSILLTVLLIASVVVCWHADKHPVSSQFDQLLYDVLLPWEAEKPDPRIVIVEIDDQSLARIGRWPWPRAKIVALIDEILARQPAVVGLDILFPEAADSVTDKQLQHILSGSGVVSGITFGGQKDTTCEYKGYFWSEYETRIGLSASLVTEDTRFGHLTPLFDADGSIRRLEPYICHQQHCTQMFALAILESLLLADTQLNVPDHAFANPKVCLANYCQRMTSAGRVMIPFHKNYRYQRVSALDLVDGVSAVNFKGAVVLLGSSAVGLGDHVKTPLAPLTPGVDIHAYLISSWLDNEHWYIPVNQFLWMIPVLCLWYMVACGWIHLTDTSKAVLIGSGLLLSGGLIALPRFGLWISPTPFLILFGLGTVILLFSDALSVILGRRALYRAFSSYVPPVVLKQIIALDSPQDALKSRRVDATVMFADIADFTALSEKLRPEQLTEMTNYIFTELTKDIHHFQGTLDKYMGDAVMAFWGAPIDQPDHTYMAWQCAIALQLRMNRMRPWLQKRGYPQVKLNIGIETGPVVVGDMGSTQRRAYTVMGYTVNVAAHIQRVCKAHRQSILVGPYMARVLPNEQILLIKQVNVKGISKPLTLAAPSQRVFDAYIADL
jgi:adenylate cyclase